MPKVVRVRRRCRDDEGTIAVMAAVIIPVVLLVLALAMSTLVWGASETEVQRASDQAAVQSAATELLVDFPYPTVDALSNVSALYPTLQGVTGQLAMTAPSLSPCTTLGDPLLNAVSSTVPTVTTTYTTVIQLIGGVLTPVQVPHTTSTLTAVNSGLAGLDATTTSILNSLPASCSGVVGPIAPIPAVPNTSIRSACDTASANVTDAAAPYASRFYGHEDNQPQPTCANGRVSVAVSTGSPLLGFAGTAASTGDALNLTVPSGFDAVQSTLAGLGVHLNTALPNLLCPQVSVGVDQPVKGPIFSMVSTPNGRSTARRVIKNAVVVPVFNGVHLNSDTSVALLGASGQSSISGGVTTNPVNLNSLLLQKLQKQLLGEMDKLDTAINNKLTAANRRVQQLNGVYDSVNATSGNTLPGTDVSVGNLDLLKCVRQTLGNLYDPPSGDVATVDDVLRQAAADGEPVNLIQMGVTSCAGALSTAAALSCVQAATGAVSGAAAAAAGAVTGLYDVPLLDVTPAMVKDVGNGNYAAVPVHASQANGAFRATLVRSSADSRYAP
ncbi:MAG: hypothetical protein JWL79_1125 [Frankiales bacterium]|nr:hypothetical protein [Frankiales bacterium]